MSGLETTEPRLGLCIYRRSSGLHDVLARKRINLTNASSRSIESFSSVSNEKVDGGEAVQKKRKEADLDGKVENKMEKKLPFFIAYILIVPFTLYQDVKKGMLHVSFK